MLEPRFAAVAETFGHIIGKSDDRGAALCVNHRGAPVVDLWAGTADVKTRRPWGPDTIRQAIDALLAAVASPP